jgi:hypothetical protein
MKKLVMIGSTIVFFLAIFSQSLIAGTAIKINSASVDLPGEMLILNGINFDAFGPVSVTLGNICFGYLQMWVLCW